MNSTTELELWKPIHLPDYTHYEVSNMGRVRNTRRRAKSMKPDVSGGYPVVRLHNKNTYKKMYVHRLVGFAFLSDDFIEGLTINHKNGIKTDNRVENLEWVTQSENSKHAWRTGLITKDRIILPPRGLNKGTFTSKYRSPVFLEKIYKRLLNGEKVTTMAKEFGSTTSHLSEYLKYQYGSEHIDNIYNSEVQGKIPDYRIDEFYQLILSGYTMKDISNEYGVDKDIRRRIYRYYGREHVSKLLDKNVAIKKKKQSEENFKNMHEEIEVYYEMMLKGENFSDIGKEFNLSHKTIRKRLNLQYGKEHIDKIRFTEKV